MPQSVPKTWCHSPWPKPDGHMCQTQSAVIWKSANVQRICRSQKVSTDQNFVCGIFFWRWTVQQTIRWLTQFSATAGLDNKMKMKSRLLPFSLIRIWCKHRVGFQFHNLPSLSMTVWLTVWLDILGHHSKSHFCDCVFSWLTRKHHWSVWQDPVCDFYFSQIKKLILLPDIGSLRSVSN